MTFKKFFFIIVPLSLIVVILAFVIYNYNMAIPNTLTPQKSAVIPEKITNIPDTSSDFITVTAEKAIKLRKTPSLDLEEITTIPKGKQLKIVEKTNQKVTLEGIESYWYKVEYANTIGYVFGGFTTGEKAIVANKSTTKEVHQMLKKYFDAVENNTMRSEEYFSASIIQYNGNKNITPVALNKILTENKEFLNMKVTITEELILEKKENGINYYSFWANTSCLRSSMNKIQLSKVEIEVGIDENTKICSYKEIKTENLKYVDKSI